MKRFFSLFLTLAAAIGLLSCSKNAPAVSGDAPEAVPDATLTVNIGMENEAVKATAAQVKDFQIGKVQVFVFDSAGKLETSYYEEGLDKNITHSVKIATFTGAKTVYVIVNHNRITHFKPHTTTITNLEAEITDLSMNTPSSLVMSGKNSVNVKKYGNNGAAGTDGDLSAVSVYVKRLAAMIQLDNLQVDFRGTDLEGATFTVQQIYLKNVVGKSRLGVSGLTGAANSAVLPLAIDDATHSNIDNWYNKFTLQASGAPAVTYESDMDVACNVSGTATAMARHLFAYPNRQDTDTHSPATGTFSPRHTRFVIKAHVKAAAGYSDYDADTFYVFDLPVLQANNIYKITSIKITMLGKDSDDKDDDLQAGKIQPTITVDPWNGPISLSYEF
ncbi:MAG: hypothetical protein IJR12_03765 [Bacteroidales bacterium]|nr:hypothetical protein [Bacteroidales bacterium]